MYNSVTIFILLAVVLVTSNCQKSTAHEMNNQEQKSKIIYPYIASGKRVDYLMAGYSKLKIGMTKEQVVQILGPADEIHDTIDKNNWSEIVGYSYVYILRRISVNGSIDDKNESLIRVLFDMNDETIKIDKW